MSKLINYDGVVQTVYPKNGRDFQLEELQKFVGGYIEIIRLDEKYQMVCNEEGKILGLPYNYAATRIYNMAPLTGRDVVVGNVLVCGMDEIV